MQTNPADMIDARRYPIHRTGTARAQLIDEVGGRLRADGCAILKGFVRADTLID